MQTDMSGGTDIWSILLKVGLAIVILIVTWILASIVKWAIGKLVKKVPALQRDGSGGEQIGRSIGQIASLLVWMFGLVAVLQLFNLDQVLSPLQGLLNGIFGFLPNLIGAGFIFFIGFVFAKIVKQLLQTALSAVDLTKLTAKVQSVGAKATGVVDASIGGHPADGPAGHPADGLSGHPAGSGAPGGGATSAAEPMAQEPPRSFDDTQPIGGPVPPQGQPGQPGQSGQPGQPPQGQHGFDPNRGGYGQPQQGYSGPGYAQQQAGYPGGQQGGPAVGGQGQQGRPVVQPAVSREPQAASANAKIVSLVGNVVFGVIMIVVSIAALQVLGIAAISAPAQQMLEIFLNAIPAIIAAGILLAIGFVIAKFVGRLLEQILVGVGTDRAIGAIGIVPEGTSASAVITKIAQVAIMIFFAIMAARMLGFPEITNILNEILDLGGSVLFGGVIIAAGFLVAALIGKFITNQMASRVLRYSAIALFIAMGLRYMGLADSIINLAFGAVVIGGALAAALAFGLGGREAAAKLLNKVDVDAATGSSNGGVGSAGDAAGSPGGESGNPGGVGGVVGSTGAAGSPGTGETGSGRHAQD